MSEHDLRLLGTGFLTGWTTMALWSIWMLRDAICRGIEIRLQKRGVPGMDTPYPATEPDLDSRDEYEYEDAPLLQEDRR